MPAKLKIPTLRKYQKRAVKFLEEENRGAILLRPGAGKTGITLTYLKKWFKKNPGKKTLVIGPKNVIYDAWEEEPIKWGCTFKVRNLHRDGYADGYDLYLINPNMFVSSLNQKWVRNFDGLIVDESTMFKKPTSQRTQNYHRYIDVIKPEMGIILTGTPVTKNLLDIYCPYYLIDKKRLGPDYYFYRGHFFEPSTDGTQWLPQDGAEEEIVRRLSYRTFILTKKEEDEIGYPAIVENDIYFKLSPPSWEKYKKLLSELIVDVESHYIDKSHHKGKIYTGAVLYGYATQFTSGNFYEHLPIEDDKFKKVTRFIHNERLNVLKDLIEVLNGAPLLVAYHYSFDLKMFEKLKIKKSAVISGKTTAVEAKKIMAKWNKGELTCLFAQISTVSHGLNLQFGGSDICLYNLPDDYEKYFQLIHRIARPGQKKASVNIHRIICRYTMDEVLRLQILNKKIVKANDFNKMLRTFIKRK